MIRAISAMVALLAASVASPAMAKGEIALESEIFVERIAKSATGSRILLERPTKLLPGDRLVFIVSYKNTGAAPASDVVITNPIPKAVRFQETLDGSEQVSVDGGQSWSRLEDLRIALDDGRFRPASPADVTHIRWVISQTLTEGYTGKLTFRGVVR